MGFKIYNLPGETRSLETDVGQEFFLQMVQVCQVRLVGQYLGLVIVVCVDILAKYLTIKMLGWA